VQDIVIDQFKRAEVGDTAVQWWDVKRGVPRVEGEVTAVTLVCGPRGGILEGSSVEVKWGDEAAPRTYQIDGSSVMPRLRREGEVLDWERELAR
jgi:hypothetical protein